MLLFTCVLGLKQGYGPISDTHHFDVSVTELALEFEVEESAQDDTFTPDHTGVVEVAFTLCKTLFQPSYTSVIQSIYYTTPLTRAPPLA